MKKEKFKIWHIEMDIETIDSFDIKMLRREIDQYLNKGQGLYAEIGKAKIKLIKKGTYAN